MHHLPNKVPMPHKSKELQMLATLRQMKTLVAELEQVVHQGMPADHIWSKLRDCNSKLVSD